MNQPLQQNPSESGFVVGPDLGKTGIAEDSPGRKLGRFAQPEISDDDLVKRLTRQVESANKAFLEWEKLRLAYNVILLALVLLSCATYVGWSAFQDIDFWLLLIFSWFMANVCFCVGPWIEGWLAVIGAERRLARWLLFLPGMLLACTVTGLAMVAWHLKAFGNWMG